MLPRSAVIGRQLPIINARGRRALRRARKRGCTPSGAWRITVEMELLEAPIATAEFMVVDTETNGLGGDSCELTEIGAVLVGGGELHERWSSLVRTSAPLRRGIQRFTGITQAMVDGAPPLESVPAATCRAAAWTGDGRPQRGLRPSRPAPGLLRVWRSTGQIRR